ncbi:MAG: phosphoribosyltransferase family protein, partial [Pseudomonadales bacterium]
GLKRSVRLRNLKSAFVATPAAEGRPFVIVDDVMTTGATMDAAATALKAAGATSVIAWSLARTARH